MVYVFDAQKTAMMTMNVVSVDAVIASILSQLESYSSLKEEQRMTLKASQTNWPRSCGLLV